MFRDISAFCGTQVAQNVEITWKTPSSDCGISQSRLHTLFVVQNTGNKHSDILVRWLTMILSQVFTVLLLYFAILLWVQFMKTTQEMPGSAAGMEMERGHIRTGSRMLMEHCNRTDCSQPFHFLCNSQIFCALLFHSYQHMSRTCMLEHLKYMYK